MTHVIVVGGGAAGMYAAIAAADNGCRVDIYEQNEKLGKKLFITGKGRCNVTNNCEKETFFANVNTNPKFLYSAYASCTSKDVMDFFSGEGLSLKTERGQRVFPQSDHSSDVIRTLERALSSRGVNVHLRTRVVSLLTENYENKDTAVDTGTDISEESVSLKGKSGKKSKKQTAGKKVGKATGILLEGGVKVSADEVIVATGGLSYPSTGSTGAGFGYASALGIDVTECYPALVPVVTKEKWPTTLQGLSLKNVSLRAQAGGKTLYEEQGEMMFTHFGITGPLVLTLSSRITERLSKEEVKLFLDMKPSLSFEKLDARLVREFEAESRKQLKNVMGSLLPSGMVPVFIRLAGIEPDRQVSLISKEEREGIVRLLKCIPMTAVAVRGFSEAIITRGGISVKEIRPSNMESVKYDHLYFIGEVLDVDAYTGGFNLQIAWATGYACGSSIY